MFYPFPFRLYFRLALFSCNFLNTDNNNKFNPIFSLAEKRITHSSDFASSSARSVVNGDRDNLSEFSFFSLTPTFHFTFFLLTQNEFAPPSRTDIVGSQVRFDSRGDGLGRYNVYNYQKIIPDPPDPSASSFDASSTANETIYSFDSISSQSQSPSSSSQSKFGYALVGTWLEDGLSLNKSKIYFNEKATHVVSLHHWFLYSSFFFALSSLFFGAVELLLAHFSAQVDSSSVIYIS